MIKFAGLAESERGGWFEPKRKAYLVPQSEGGAPVPLDSPQIVVGRGNGLDYQVPDPTTSRRHARVLVVHNRYYVQDLGSANGTFVNLDKVTNRQLAHGDLVAFGKTVFRFVITAAPDRDYLKKLNLDALIALADVVDKKDAYTGNHSRVVARVAQRLASELGFSPTAAERVGIGGRLHNIGLIGVPDAVLQKTGRLTDAEFDLIHRHPRDGAEILEPLAFLEDVLPMVRQHHERFDGRGHPDGLAGQDIAVEARIISVADAYQAMTSERPYRKPLLQEFVRQEFAKGAGAQFDPDIARAFMRLLPAMPGLISTLE